MHRGVHMLIEMELGAGRAAALPDMRDRFGRERRHNRDEARRDDERRGQCGNGGRQNVAAGPQGILAERTVRLIVLRRCFVVPRRRRGVLLAIGQGGRLR